MEEPQNKKFEIFWKWHTILGAVSRASVVLERLWSKGLLGISRE